MQIHHRSLIAAGVLLSATVLVRAQAAADASGHWEGVVKAPGHEVPVQIDLTRRANGDVLALFSGENVKGYPLSDVVIERRTVRFQLKVNGGGSFSGTIADDGRTIAGDFTTTDGAHTMPFSLTRTGDVKIDPPVKNAPITKQLEGT